MDGPRYVEYDDDPNEVSGLIDEVTVEDDTGDESRHE